MEPNKSLVYGTSNNLLLLRLDTSYPTFVVLAKNSVKVALLASKYSLLLRRGRERIRGGGVKSELFDVTLNEALKKELAEQVETQISRSYFQTIKLLCANEDLIKSIDITALISDFSVRETTQLHIPNSIYIN